jgi:hypothetical protein
MLHVSVVKCRPISPSSASTKADARALPCRSGPHARGACSGSAAGAQDKERTTDIAE